MAEIVVTFHGRPAGVLIDFASEVPIPAWSARARHRLASGRCIALDDLVFCLWRPAFASAANHATSGKVRLLPFRRETCMTGLARFSQVLWIFAGFDALMRGKVPSGGLGFSLARIAVAAVGVGLIALLPIPKQGWGKIWYWGWMILGIIPLFAAVIFVVYLGLSEHEGSARATLAMLGELFEALIALALGSGLGGILQGMKRGEGAGGL